MLTLNDLLTLQDVLDAALVDGTLELHEYSVEWTSLLSVSGWTQARYEEEIDRRWDYVTVLTTQTARRFV